MATIDNGVVNQQAAPALDVEKYVDKFVQLRDKKKAMDDAHKAAVKPYNDVMDKIGDVLMQFLAANNLSNVKTGAGTASPLDKWTATVEDPAAFRDWLLANNMFDLANISGNAPNIRAYLDQHGQLPPGVKLNNFRKIGVRRAGSSAE